VREIVRAGKLSGGNMSEGDIPCYDTAWINSFFSYFNDYLVVQKLRMWKCVNMWLTIVSLWLWTRSFMTRGRCCVTGLTLKNRNYDSCQRTPQRWNKNWKSFRYCHWQCWTSLRLSLKYYFCHAVLCVNATFAFVRRLPVCLSVCHVHVLCWNEWTYSRTFFTFW